MNCRALYWLVPILLLPITAAAVPQATRPADDVALRQLAQDRRLFQDQDLTTAAPMAFVFNSGQPPRIIWRDVETVRQLGCQRPLSVRWFDADLKESQIPSHPGRWGAWIEGVAPNGTTLRRLMTFYCRPPAFLFYFPQPLPPLPPKGGPITPEAWKEHEDELGALYQDAQLRGLNGTESGAILIAGLSEAGPQGHTATTLESAAVRNDDFGLALKLKVMGLESRVRGLKPPRKLPADAAPALHRGTMAQAGMVDDAAGKIESVCRQWARDSREPFVALVARHGIIVVHQAFGADAATGKPIGLDYRCGVFSITKTITAMLFAQFVDQGLISLDDSVASVFPDFPHDPRTVPTFRQCFTHTSGFTGHGDWGGSHNAHLENILLNGIDANRPGAAYVYSGQGFDLSAKAMEIVSGKSWRRLFEESLFRPLGFGDVPMDNASAGAQCTAGELGALAQLMANRGAYGKLVFMSRQTFEQLLPENLENRFPGIHESEGIGMHYIKHLRQDRAAGSTRPADQIFSPNTVGHGSLSSSIFLIDLDRDLIVVQVRKQAGDRYAQWSSTFFQTIVESIKQ